MTLVPKKGTKVRFTLPARVVGIDGSTKGGPFVEVELHYRRAAECPLRQDRIWLHVDDVDVELSEWEPDRFELPDCRTDALNLATDAIEEGRGDVKDEALQWLDCALNDALVEIERMRQLGVKTARKAIDAAEKMTASIEAQTSSMREAFTPKPGEKIVSTSLGAAEVRLVASELLEDSPQLPPEVEKAVRKQFLHVLTPGGEWEDKPLDPKRVVFGHKPDIAKGEVWDRARQTGVAVYRHDRNGWRKCHTDNFWVYYAYETSAEYKVDLAKRAQIPDDIECNVCGQTFNPVNLGDVLLHEHKGITDDPATKKLLDSVGPGRRVTESSEDDPDVA